MNTPTFNKGIPSKRVLQNATWMDSTTETPTISIAEGDKEWSAAYSNWLQGKPPTDSTEWKRGVFLHFEPIDELQSNSMMSSTFMSDIVLACKFIALLLLSLLLLVLLTFARF